MKDLVFKSIEEMEEGLKKLGYEVFEIEGDRIQAVDESYQYIYNFSLIKENGLVIVY